MNSIREKIFNTSSLAKFLAVFTLCQPLIDIATSFIARAGIGFTLGIAVRSLFLLAAVLYVFFFSKYPRRRAFVIYIAVLLAYSALYAAQFLRGASLSALIENVSVLIKVFYFPIVLVSMVLAWKEFGVTVSGRALTLTGVIYTASIVLAVLTGTSFKSYASLSAYGFTGWFYAANEIGPIVIMLSLEMLLYYFTEHLLKPRLGVADAKKRALVLLSFVLVALLTLFCAEFLGTKVAFIVPVIYLLIVCLWMLVQVFFGKGRTYLRTLFVCMALLIAMAAIYPVSAVRANITGVLSWKLLAAEKNWETQISLETKPTETSESSASESLATDESGTPVTEPTEPSIFDSAWFIKLNGLLSNRFQSVNQCFRAYVKAPLSTKLLGLGYANLDRYNEYIDRAIEMDFVSVFFRHGILGFAVFCAPYFYLLFSLLGKFLGSLRKTLSSLKCSSYMFITLVIFVVGFLTGHTFVAPAVSYFVAVYIVKLKASLKEALAAQ